MQGARRSLDYPKLRAKLGSLQARGNLGEARKIYRKVLRDDNPPALQLFGRIARRHALPDLAAKLLAKAIRLGADGADDRNELGLAHLASGALTAAAAEFEGAIAIEPGEVRWWINLATVCKEAGRIDTAAEHLVRALDLDPGYANAHSLLGELRLLQGRPVDALASLDAALESKARIAWPLALRSTAFAELGDREAFRDLMRYEDHCRCVHADTPDGFADLAAFHRSLAQHIGQHPSLQQSPRGLSTHHGWHTLGNLLADAVPVTDAMEALVRQAVAEYCSGLPALSDHRFHAERPAEFRLEGWGVRLHRNGFQEAHIHREGWLSGVYYARLDGIVRDDDPEHEGWLELGRGREDLQVCGGQPETRLVKPEEGMFALFPSYVWHRTRPFRADRRRIVFAFDVIPLD